MLGTERFKPLQSYSSPIEKLSSFKNIILMYQIELDLILGLLEQSLGLPAPSSRQATFHCGFNNSELYF